MFLNKKKEYKRKLNDIGKEKYYFDLKKEKNIYSYVSCYKMKKSTIKKLDDELKFDSYGKWKKYVSFKYSDYEHEMLVEFSRYLNQRMRNVNYRHTYWGMIIPIMLTLIISKVFELWFEMNLKVPEEFYSNMLELVIVHIIVFAIKYLIVFVPGYIMIKEVIEPLTEDNIEKNFFEDYKEIIDEIIEGK